MKSLIFSSEEEIQSANQEGIFVPTSSNISNNFISFPKGIVPKILGCMRLVWSCKPRVGQAAARELSGKDKMLS